MSYIRSGSNPERLYIFGTGRGQIEIGLRWIPRHVFHGILKAWLRSEEACCYRGAKLAQDDSGLWLLSYKNWAEPISMWHTTLYYLAKSNEFRWQRRRR